LINLASATHQALAVEFMVKKAKTLEQRVYSVPAEVDAEIAGLKLKAMGVAIDELTAEQVKYLNSREEGT
jgi:adenosylhomocysteinase